jgi:hypothetical protein
MYLPLPQLPPDQNSRVSYYPDAHPMMTFVHRVVGDIEHSLDIPQSVAILMMILL